MAVDDLRFRARRELEGLGLSMESASYLLDDQPPGGWDSLATKADLAELRAEFHKELRGQTWQLAKLVAGAQGLVVVAIAAIGVVLRFA
jgi:hypothetical protein